ncbi:MAG: PrgI family protein [Defluviitaleaceae bacterium]|nr:PrgI family protein [Defluviitaleaceae bacterium]
MEDLHISIPKDLDKMTVKAGLFTKRQWTYLGIAAALGFIAYQIASRFMPITGAVWIIIIIVMPACFLAFYKRDGMSVENLLLLKLRFWLFPSVRSSQPALKTNPEEVKQNVASKVTSPTNKATTTTSPSKPKTTTHKPTTS